MRRPQLKIWQWIVLALGLAIAVDWFIQRPDGRAREINAILERDASPQLKAYPYPFRVLRVEGDVAVIGTPRNPSVPALRVIELIHPEVNVLNANDPAFVAAQTELASIQSEALRIVAAQPGIRATRWELDRRWLSAHGIDVSDAR